MKRTMLQKAAAPLCGMLLLTALLAGCSSADSKQAGSSQSTSYNTEAKADSLQHGTAENVDQSAAKAVSAGGGPSAANQSSSGSAMATASPSATASIPDALNRKIMYKANLVMRTDNYGEARTKVQDVVALSGGYVLQFSENTGTNEKSGNFTIKVPASGFSSLLDKLETISLFSQRSVQGQDVSEEYVDLDSRLKAKQVVETRLLSFMEKATKTDELLAFSNELAKVQEEIERMKGRMRYIDQNVAMSTIELRLYQKAEAASSFGLSDASPFGKRIGGALDFSISAIVTIVQSLVLFIVGALPIALLLAVIAAPFWYFIRARRLKQASLRKEVFLRQSGSESEDADRPE
ncbi:DUF4349 domain-containing protein [Paenibacillus thalictri]|uniref:DUF4349 domain-containing protein n=1 Tax=Paenibacillus thalictri TaxID=2527873 RepID=A0A4Q9DSS9_9BACL|nr:DUF4349 domain-containing protein [Paenibacillus thalictri]TBL78144.1 DUF4349 domain-containing protein [Paenibacillus thalictri]